MRFGALILAALWLTACTGGAYHLPKQEYQQKVKTIGVVPILVDEQSTIQHPQRQAVVQLLLQHSEGKAQHLVEVVRDAKAYFDVRPINGTSQALFAGLVEGSQLHGETGKLYRDYRFKAGGVSNLCRDHVVDGLLVVVLYGVERVENRRDRNLLNYLDAKYNSVQSRAFVVLPSGEVVWEYPAEDGRKFLDLQYPDFDEAYYNKTDEVKIKFISVAGLDRTLGEQTGGFFKQEEFPKPYHDLFADLAGALKPGWFSWF